MTTPSNLDTKSSPVYTHREPPLPNRTGVSRPNILIFMPDQLRYDALGCTGNSHVRTPNIDAFAARGIRFTNCFTQASVCTQSRVSMFTGQYPHIHGHRSIDNMIKPWEPNLFRSLKEVGGYHVACLAPRGDLFAPEVVELSVDEYGFLETPEYMPGNWREGGMQVPEGDLDDIWHRLFYKGRREVSEAFDYDEGAIRSAEMWLRNPPEKPWCLFLPLFFPHVPFWAEEPYFSMYKREDMPAPASLNEKTGHEPQYMAAIREAYGTHRATPEMWAECHAVYLGMITRLDDRFGRLMDLLSATGLDNKTVTMMFTDHGEYLGDYGLVEKWPSGLSDSLVHEPLIIGGAGLPEGKVVDEMAEMVDLVPTIFHLCGIGEHFGHNGTSWLDTIYDGAKHKEYAFSEGGFLTSEEPLIEDAKWPYDLKAKLQHQDPTLVGKAVSMRSKKWTYIYRLYEEAELYDRENDPKELHNLAAKPDIQHVVRMLESVLMRWLVEKGDVMPWIKDPRRAKVDLEDPRTQFERRNKRISGL